MSSASNLDTNTLGVPPPATKDAAAQLRHIRRRASLTLACSECCSGARDADELRQFLDMFGLPPCERPLRTYKSAKHRPHAEGART